MTPNKLHHILDGAVDLLLEVDPTDDHLVLVAGLLGTFAEAVDARPDDVG